MGIQIEEMSILDGAVTVENVYTHIRDICITKKDGGYKLSFEKINCTNEDDADVKSIQTQFNIEGYPTIKLIKNNEVIEYDAKPDKETLNQFLQTVLT